jgi:hypothetical protein
VVRKYRGFLVDRRQIYESVEKRVARGDTTSLVVGYYFRIWIPMAAGRWRKMRGESGRYATEIELWRAAKWAINTIIDNLS